jgi:hypothetical protein
MNTPVTYRSTGGTNTLDHASTRPKKNKEKVEVVENHFLSTGGASTHGTTTFDARVLARCKLVDNELGSWAWTPQAVPRHSAFREQFALHYPEI